MRVYDEEQLRYFKFWSGGKVTADLLTPQELDSIEEKFFNEDRGYTATEINDFFWFDDDAIAEYLGYDDFEDMWNKRYLKK